MKKQPITIEGIAIAYEFHSRTPKAISEAIIKILEKRKIKDIDPREHKTGRVLDPGWDGWPPPNGVVADFRMTLGEFNLLQDIVRAIRYPLQNIINEAKADGIKEGANLLFSLNNGELSMKDFESKIK